MQDFQDEYIPGDHRPDVHLKKKKRNGYVTQLILFVVTVVSTIIAGFEWRYSAGSGLEIEQLATGIPYSVSILFFLICHEFGHYFAARYHKVDTTLPYFIPWFSFFGFFLSFGTLGAVIKIKGSFPSRKALFDIGAAGPIAGFIACTIILLYGFTHLPGKEYLLSIHPDYFSPKSGANGLQLEFGDSLIFIFLRAVFSSPDIFIPPMSEIYHYPYLCVGWFGLFVTSMNMIPVGQLDGGHIVYALFGKKHHERIAGVSIILLIILGVLGVLQSFYLPWIKIGWMGWLFWATVLFFVLRMHHPEPEDTEPLDKKRKIIGYLSIAIFVICFSPSPFFIGM